MVINEQGDNLQHAIHHIKVKNINFSCSESATILKNSLFSDCRVISDITE